MSSSCATIAGQIAINRASEGPSHGQPAPPHHPPKPTSICERVSFSFHHHDLTPFHTHCSLGSSCCHTLQACTSVASEWDYYASNQMLSRHRAVTMPCCIPTHAAFLLKRHFQCLLVHRSCVMTAGPCDWLHQSCAGVLDTRPMCERFCHVYLVLTDRHSKVVHAWSQASLVTNVNETLRLGATDKTSDASSPACK